MIQEILARIFICPNWLYIFASQITSKLSTLSNDHSTFPCFGGSGIFEAPYPVFQVQGVSWDFGSGQLLSCVRFSVTPWTAVHQASLSITKAQSLLRLMPAELVMPSNHLILCHPLFLLPSIFPNIRVFSNESLLRIRWPEYWSFSFSIGPSNKYSGLTSIKMDWLDLLALQGTLKSLLQHCSSKVSVLWRSAWDFSQMLMELTYKAGKCVLID